MSNSTKGLSIIGGGGVTQPCKSSRARYLAQCLIFTLSSFLFIPQSFADCINPAGIEGEQVYNGTHKTMQFCDGADWYGMKGGGTGGGIDDDPDNFTFTDQTDALLGTLITSNEVTITGIDPFAVVAVSGDGNAESSVNGGAWTSQNNVILNGQTLQIRLISNAAGATENVATINMGGMSDNWSVTTFNSAPAAFSFNDLTGQAKNTVITSNSINITGIAAPGGPVPVSVSGEGTPQIRIAGGSWVTSGTISNGQSLQMRLTSSNANSTARAATVNVGGVTDNWSVTTGALTWVYQGWSGCVDGSELGGYPDCGSVGGVGGSCASLGEICLYSYWDCGGSFWDVEYAVCQ